MSLDEASFETLASRTLARWLDAIEAVGADRLEPDLEGGVLTIAAEGAGTFLINKHAPLRQLWLSSPFSGASHFAYDPQSRRWRNTRGAGDLAELLSAELQRAAGVAVTLSE